MTRTRILALSALPMLALAGACAKQGELVVDSGVGVTALRTACPTVGVPDYTGDITTFSGTAIVRSDDITQDPRYGKTPPYYGMPEGHLPVRSYLAVPVTGRSEYEVP